jgi:hypothetical protein
MTAPGRQTKLSLPAGQLGPRRLGSYLLVVLYKAALCLLLTGASLECGFEPEEAGEAVQQIAEAIIPASHRCTRQTPSRARHDALCRPDAHRCSPAARRAGAGHADRAPPLATDSFSRPNGQRDPPVC